MKQALIIIDVINDIVDHNGKLANKGYPKFIEKYNTIENINLKIQEFRETNEIIIFVKIEFKKDYSNQPKNSPLFGKAQEFSVFQAGSWGTEFYKDLQIYDSDKVFIKERVSAFHKTGLNAYLQEQNVKNVFLAGCSTDLAIESAARDGHDLDFNIFVLKDCCAAADLDTHTHSIKILSKIAHII